MRSPVFLSPQLIFQTASLATGGLVTEITQTLQCLLVQQQLQLAHCHRVHASVHLRGHPYLGFVWVAIRALGKKHAASPTPTIVSHMTQG